MPTAPQARTGRSLRAGVRKSLKSPKCKSRPCTQKAEAAKVAGIGRRGDTTNKDKHAPRHTRRTVV